MSSVEDAELWEAIVAKASTLSERLDAYRRGRSTRVAPPAGTMDAWADSACGGDTDLMLERVSSLGLKPSDLPECLAEPIVTHEDLPDWCRVLVAVAAPQTGVATLLARSKDRDPGALPELLEPLLCVAVAELHRRHSEMGNPVNGPLLRDLVHDLHLQLSNLTQTCVAAEIRRMSDVGGAGFNTWARWMDQQVEDGSRGFWRTYPALARLVGITVNDWVARTSELLTRANSDLGAISRSFGRPVVRLARVEFGLSDPHRGHATVVDCQFVDIDGLNPHHVIYKPKSIATEAAFAALCDELNGRGLDLGQPPKVLSRGGYGWVEKVEMQPASDSGDVDSYYRRAGALVAILFALGATDIHGENVVAHRDRPVVIDAETIMQPVPDPLKSNLMSVRESRMLPGWTRLSGVQVDVSALGPPNGWDDVVLPKVQWVYAGGPDARLVATSERSSRRRSLLLDELGRPTLAADHIPQLVDGFEVAWRVLSDAAGEERGGEGGREGVASASGSETPSGLFEGFRAAPIRIVLRTTADYSQLLADSIRPALYTDGLKRSFHFERLARCAVNQGRPGLSWALIDTERDQLEVGDIPYFSARTESRGIHGPNGEPIITFATSALDRATARLAAMSDDELIRQREILIESVLGPTISEGG